VEVIEVTTELRHCFEALIIIQFCHIPKAAKFKGRKALANIALPHQRAVNLWLLAKGEYDS
jgi:hypothetical protein